MTIDSTDLRRIEIARNFVSDLDLGRQTPFVDGKGKKNRVMPIGERALEWNERYLCEVRQSFARDLAEQGRYLSEYGKRLSDDGLSHRATEYVNAANLGKAGSCHLFRHSCTTPMLERGADVRALQELLGHSKLDTTMIYTQVSVGHVNSEHACTHPSARRPNPENSKENSEQQETE